MKIEISYSDELVYFRVFDEEVFFEKSKCVPSEWKNYLKGFKGLFGTCELCDFETTDFYNPDPQCDPECIAFIIDDESDDRWIIDLIFSVYFRAYQIGFQDGIITKF